MTEIESLLITLMEECAEVTQACSKVLRFGPRDVEPGQQKENDERLFDEWTDAVAVFQMLQKRLKWPDIAAYRIIAKQQKVREFIEYSRERGLVSTTEEVPTASAKRVVFLAASESNEPEPAP
jgi:NTP pyrophosphatase (non-canonical NTP hydrolase)